MLGSEDRQIAHFLVSLFHWFSTWHEKKKNQARQNFRVYTTLVISIRFPKQVNWRNSPLLGANAPLTTTTVSLGKSRLCGNPTSFFAALIPVTTHSCGNSPSTASAIRHCARLLISQQPVGVRPNPCISSLSRVSLWHATLTENCPWLHWGLVWPHSSGH